MSSSESEWIDEVTEPAPAESHAAEPHTADPVDVDAHLLSRIQADIEESLLGGPRCFTQSQIAEFAGVTRERADRLWVAMGFAVDEDPDASCSPSKTPTPSRRSSTWSIEESSRRAVRCCRPFTGAVDVEVG